MVEKGAIEMAVSVQGYNPGRFPQSSVMELPLMFDNRDIGAPKLMLSLYKEGAARQGLRFGEGAWSLYPAAFIRSSRPARRSSRSGIFAA